MTEPDRPDWETDTAPIPRVRASGDTIEMPVVRRPRRARRGPPPGGQPPRPRSARSGGRSAVLLGVALLLAVAAGALVGRLLPPADETAPAAAPEATAGDEGEAVTAAWSSVDPAGGSGFRQVDGQTWRTQSYRTAEFGNLKPGVGLLADLGEPRELSAVSLDVAPDGVVVELRAGPAASDDPADYEVVAPAEAVTGPTTLDAADGGEHRYWLVWVTELGPREGGFVAELRDPQVIP